MTVTIDICDNPVFRRIAKERIKGRVYYEMDNGLYTLDRAKAKEFTKEGSGSCKVKTKTRYSVADKDFEHYDDAIEHSMTMLILTFGFNFKNF